MSISASIMLLLVGSGLLAWGADRFVTGAAASARNFGVPSLIIGIVLVGFATSFPEMLVSALAAFHGNPNIGVGNALGSNITNVGLVLGLTALITPLSVHSRLLRREYPVLLITIFLAAFLLLDGRLGRVDGYLLITAFFLILGWMLYVGMQARSKKDPIAEEARAELPAKMSTFKALFWLVFGFAMLYISSRILIVGAINIARYLGASDFVIGLSIVAIGTSLPELAASIVAAIKGEHDIAVGNVVGSNIFNLTAVLAMPGLIAPGLVPRLAILRDIPVMFLFTLLLIAMSYGFRGPGRINRYEGAVLLLGYMAYIAVLFIT